MFDIAKTSLSCFVYENDSFFYAVKVLGVLLVIELGMAALVAAIS